MSKDAKSTSTRLTVKSDADGGGNMIVRSPAQQAAAWREVRHSGSPSDNVEKVSIGQAVSEIRQRLGKIADNTAALREHVLGENPGIGGPANPFQAGLDAAVFEMFPVLAVIEADLERLKARLGVSDTPKPANRLSA